MLSFRLVLNMSVDSVVLVRLVDHWTVNYDTASNTVPSKLITEGNRFESYGLELTI